MEMQIKNKDEHCSNCEYSLSPDAIDSIIKENNEGIGIYLFVWIFKSTKLLVDMI